MTFTRAPKPNNRGFGPMSSGGGASIALPGVAGATNVVNHITVRRNNTWNVTSARTRLPAVHLLRDSGQGYTAHMNWLFWSLLSALFAGTTAVLAKVGVSNVDSNLATAIRTTVVLLFTWGLALLTMPPRAMGRLSSGNWLFR